MSPSPSAVPPRHHTPRNPDRPTRGPEVAELVQAATVAIVGEVPIARLWHAVPSYPTISEIWLRLLEGYGRDSA